MTGQSSQSPAALSSGGKSAGYWVEDGTAHESCTCHIMVKGAILGSFRIDPGEWPSLRYFREGVAFFCPDCGDVWGRLVLTGHEGRQKPFEVRTVSCEKHYDPWQLSGSILAGSLVDLLNLLPDAVLRREAIIHLRQGVEK